MNTKVTNSRLIVTVILAVGTAAAGWLAGCTSKSPLGPWEYKGIYMEPTDSYTNHGSIVEYKGQWYAFYHTSAISHQDWLRSICVDKLYFNPDGTIRKVVPTGMAGIGPSQ